ncbi:MAG: glycosyltransferase, partial [Methanobacteriaceae archaeon]|nr:glycosyltransferase [Methanobacteriaceae archaeon]
VKGPKELFGDKLPTYDSKETLDKLVNFYLDCPEKRDEKIKELQEIVLNNHTYQHRAKKIKELLIGYANTKKITIKTPVPKKEDKFKWGDYHFALNLQKSLNCYGYLTKVELLDDWNTFKDSNSDIVIVLRGLSKYDVKTQHYNIMWNISHPDMITLDEYESFDHVYIASLYWVNKIKSLLKVDVDVLLQCTDTKRFYPNYDENYDTELLFVGNSRLVYRKILKDLIPTQHDLSVYGDMWDNIIDANYIKGEHINNKDLSKAYSSTKVLLNDHWDDMREKGFISNRIFDAIACGSVVVTDHVKSIEEVLPSVVYYDDPSELESKINEALKIGKIDHNIAYEHTYDKRAKTILNDYENSLS